MLSAAVLQHAGYRQKHLLPPKHTFISCMNLVLYQLLFIVDDLLASLCVTRCFLPVFHGWVDAASVAFLFLASLAGGLFLRSATVGGWVHWSITKPPVRRVCGRVHVRVRLGAVNRSISSAATLVPFVFALEWGALRDMFETFGEERMVKVSMARDGGRQRVASRSVTFLSPTPPRVPSPTAVPCRWHARPPLLSFLHGRVLVTIYESGGASDLNSLNDLDFL